MTDLEKAIWQAARGNRDVFIPLVTGIFNRLESAESKILELETRLLALESRRGPGRPPKEG